VGVRQFLIVGEDELCCELGAKIAALVLYGWTPAAYPISTGGITKLIPRLPSLVEQAEYVQPVICIADTDGECPVEKIRALNLAKLSSNFVLRFAHTEAESWVLADRNGFSSKFGVPVSKLPHSPDAVSDAKRLVLTLASRSKYRWVRDEIVSVSDVSKRGSGYNMHLISFVRDSWNVEVAKKSSESLSRACSAIARIAENA
jgi:hypothetical protein